MRLDAVMSLGKELRHTWTFIFMSQISNDTKQCVLNLQDVSIQFSCFYCDLNLDGFFLFLFFFEASTDVYILCVFLTRSKCPWGWWMFFHFIYIYIIFFYILKSALFISIFAPASSCPLLLLCRCQALYGVPPAVRHGKSMKLVDSLNFVFPNPCLLS